MGKKSDNIKKALEENKEVIFSCRTKDVSNSKYKPRVYFTCHPDDFELYSEKVFNDIIKAFDCAIYYTDDMAVALKNENNIVDLMHMNLFIIPITFRLLTKKSRAFSCDLHFAIENKIPVLPIIMEPDLDELYSKPDKFGDMQYIDACNRDMTTISYEEKLKNYLKECLISDDTFNQVRNAFSDYFFLSYRKKDRKYANELIKLIHKNPECLDIAIWYDEFLTPGENFKTNIDVVLQKSSLFLLLVTPSILENPNFVMSQEYPAAQKAKKTILPVEMESTNRYKLGQSYDNLPKCIDGHNHTDLRKGILGFFEGATRHKTIDESEHNYIIGLAYLYGIDVERNFERALELIENAAEHYNPNAMDKMYNIYTNVVEYSNGKKIRVNYEKALYWAKKLEEYASVHYGQNDDRIVKAKKNLAKAFYNLNEKQKFYDITYEIYQYYLKREGEHSINTLDANISFATAMAECGKYDVAIKNLKKAYAYGRKAFGDNNSTVINTLNNLALALSEKGKYKEAIEKQKEAYLLYSEVLGSEHVFTLCSFANIAYIYRKTGDIQEAHKIIFEAYEKFEKALGEKHHKTIRVLHNLASSYEDLGDYKEAIRLYEKTYRLFGKIYGYENPNTLKAYKSLVSLQIKMTRSKTEFFLLIMKLLWKVESAIEYETVIKMADEKIPGISGIYNKIYHKI